MPTYNNLNIYTELISLKKAELQEIPFTWLQGSAQDNNLHKGSASLLAPATPINVWTKLVNGCPKYCPVSTQIPPSIAF